MRSHQALAELAGRQYGVVSNQQLQRLGYSTSAIDRAVAAGRLHRIHRGVYAVGHRRLTKHGRCLAAVLACGRGAALSHSSAAWLWGLSGTCPRTVEVTVPSRGRSRPSIRLHHAPAMGEEDRAVVDGIPVTSVPRTLLDLAVTTPERRLEKLIERLDQLRLLDLRKVDSMLSRTVGHPGAGRLRRVLTLYREPPFTRSELEREFLRLASKAGLPRPAVNRFVEGFELDMYWEEERFAVELDGYASHGTRAAFERDRVRQEELKLAGIEMIRVTSHRLVEEPDVVMKRLAILLGRRRAAFARSD